MKFIDPTYAVVRASARKGQLLSDQQLMDLAASRDLKEFLNRTKERYPALALNVTPSLRELEDLLLRDFRDEVDEFIKMCPDAAPLLQLMKREIDEGEVADLLKQHLGILSVESTKGQPKKTAKEDVISQLLARGFGSEVKEGSRLFEKYKVPAMVDSVFARYRIIRMLEASKNLGGGPAEQLREYLKLKVDIFNVITVLRGIRNGVDRKALEEVLISHGGRIGKEDLLNALKQADESKALAYLEEIGLPKVEDIRAMERSFEKEVHKTLTHMYYHGYADIGAIVGYLELKLREVRSLIKIVNAISRGMEPKRIAPDFIF